MIPLSLLLVGLFGIYAPFNAFHSSRINQLGRMEAVLVKNNLLKNSKISVPVKIKLASVDQDKLYAALDYLAENQPQTLKKFLSEKQFSDLIAENNPYNRSNLLFKMTGFPGKNFHFVSKYFSSKERGYITLSKADFLVEDALYFDKNNKGFKQYNFEENPFSVKLENNSFILKLSKSENVVFDLSSLKTLDGGDIEMEKLTFEKENLNWKFRLLIKNGNSTSGRIDHVDWQLFLTRKINK